MKQKKFSQLARAVAELKLGSSIPDEPIIYGSSSFHTMSRAHVEPFQMNPDHPWLIFVSYDEPCSC